MVGVGGECLGNANRTPKAKGMVTVLGVRRIAAESWGLHLLSEISAL
jgi:hypothetical protein